MPDRKRKLTADSPIEKRLAEILQRLREEHPDARCELNHKDPLQLMVATILSAQCTDERVNEVTPSLFEKYQDAEAFAEADRSELEELIRSTGFFRQKAKFIQGSCRALVVAHGGRVPEEMDDLTALPGIARKTANVILGVGFGKAEGVVVDTHVMRLARRLGLSDQKDRDKIELDLMALVPRSEWIEFAHLLIFHGRRICAARKPDCPGCVVNDICPSADV